MRRENLYLNDILEAIRRIRGYTDGMSYEQYASSEITQDAVVRNLTIIGEAVRALPQDLLDREAQIPWRDILVTRNRMVHAYFNIDGTLVWDIVSRHLSDLEGATRRLLES